MLFTIVFIHEMGHAAVAHFFKWDIRKIELLPFGGVVEMNETSNRPIKEEFLVVIAGPLQHIWLIGLSYLILQTSFWTVNYHEIFVWHNLVILFFNLLPVWPLDGGRLVHLLFCNYFPYIKAYIFSLVSSVVSLVIITIIAYSLYPFHLNLWVVITFLFISNYLQWKQRHYSMIRFLLQRSNRNKRGKVKTIRCDPFTTVRDVTHLFRRDCYHIITWGKNFKLDEQTLLNRYFKNKTLNDPISSFFKF